MRKVLIAVLIAIIVFAAFVARTLISAGQFKTIRPHCEGTCIRVAGLPGPEDITIHPVTGIAFISSDDRRATRAGKPAQGAIYALDRTAKGTIPRKLTAGFDRDFHPHGLSLYLDGNGKTFLFVINHAKAGHFVEIFEYAKDVLVHRESIGHPLMFSPNDLVAVGPRSFYVTNDHGFASRSWQMLEDFFPLKRSFVLYYDGKEMRVAAKGFGYANGINISADGKTLYLAATLDKAIHLFSRDAASGVLMPAYDIDLGTGPDNIELDSSGNLYVACHPKMLDFLAHAKDKTKISPSQILKITIKGKGNDEVKEIYLNDGKEISASSVAAPFKGGFLVGQVFDDHILICTDKDTLAK
jgi:arylesterase/paraoxonase